MKFFFFSFFSLWRWMGWVDRLLPVWYNGSQCSVSTGTYYVLIESAEANSLRSSSPSLLVPMNLPRISVERPITFSIDATLGCTSENTQGRREFRSSLGRRSILLEPVPISFGRCNCHQSDRSDKLESTSSPILTWRARASSKLSSHLR